MMTQVSAAKNQGEATLRCDGAEGTLQPGCRLLVLGVQIGNRTDRFLNVRRESPFLKLVCHGGSTSLDRGRNGPDESLLNFLYFVFGHVFQVQ